MPSAVAAMLFLAAAYSGPASAAGDFPELSLDGPLPDGFVLRVTAPPAEPGASCEPLKAAGRGRFAAPCAPLRGANDQLNFS